MDMSAGDFLALFYLLKIPVEVINLKVEWSLFAQNRFDPSVVGKSQFYQETTVFTCIVFLLSSRQ